MQGVSGAQTDIAQGTAHLACTFQGIKLGKGHLLVPTPNLCIIGACEAAFNLLNGGQQALLSDPMPLVAQREYRVMYNKLLLFSDYVINL